MANIELGQFVKMICDAASIYLVSPRSRIEDLRRDADLLKAKLVDFNRAIYEVERNGQTITEETRLWKLRAETFLSTEVVNAIQQDYRAMRCLGGWSWNCVSINRRVTKKLEDVKELIIRVDVSKVAKAPPPPLPPAVELPISNNVVGMQSDVIQIVNQIRDENANVIGIYGMGGIGKTTLLMLINNHKEISHLKFEHVVWIVASKGCKLQKLQMDLAKKVGLNLEDDESENNRAFKLCNFFKEKSCLLFLDDIWQSYELLKLGMEPSEHSMDQKRKVVVFTTRSEQVCTEMRANIKKKVKGLSSNQAWKLFLKCAGEDIINSEPRINQLAQEIAQECAGVPLALITVGRAMSAKRLLEAWNDALMQLRQSQMPKVTGMKELDPMFAAFKLSYDSLENDNMRARLLCCSLWPEDFEIEKVELIQCWIGLGLIDEFDSINKAFDRGHSYIETLTFACLLEFANREQHTAGIKMHDVIRDMALWMASDCGSNQHRWIVKARAGLRQLELENEECQVVERASFMHNHLSFLPSETSTFRKLSMLMLQQNRKLDLIPGSFFQALPVLKFLDLSGTKIIELPREINMLSELQHLNLNYTQVKVLPAEVRSLVKLKYLLLIGTKRLAEIPKGTISNLPLLKLLDLYESKYTNLDELKGFKRRRRYIGITLHTMIALERLASLPQLSTWKLQLENMRDLARPSQLFETMMSSHNTRQSLERLEIIDVMTSGKLTVAQSNKDHEEGFECLRYMMLIAIDDLQEIIWKGVKPQIIFPNLHELIIVKCKMLKSITWALQLLNLSVLRVSDCGEMEELISCVGSSSNSCIGLRLLSLALLPKLNCISQQPLTFPYLERLYVSSCPEFKKLPFRAEICQNKLKGIFGKMDWWERIEWEDVNDKNSLFPYFKSDLQEIVLRLYMEDTTKSTRVKVFRTATGFPGVLSASLDVSGLLTVVGEEVDAAVLETILREKIGPVDLVSVRNN